MVVISSKSAGDTISSSDYNALVNKIQNALDTDVDIDASAGNFRLPQGTSFPGSPSIGEEFLRTDDLNKGLYYYDGSDWVNVGVDMRIIELIEFWESESIDSVLWTQSNGSTSGSQTISTGAGWIYNQLSTGATSGQYASLSSKNRFMVDTTDFGSSNSNVKKLVIKFVGRFTNVSNVDNTTFFVGLNGTQNGTRAAVNIAGFYLTSDALATVTDSGGTETTDTTSFSGTTLTDKNLYEIHVSNGAVDFYVNGTNGTQSVTNLPSEECYFDAYVKNDAAAVGSFDISNLEVYYER